MRRFKSFIRLVASIGNEFFARNGPYMAAAVSFYALFSMFPLMLALIAVAGFFLESESFRDRLIEGIPEVLPVEGDLVASIIANVTSGAAVGSVLAAIGLFWPPQRYLELSESPSTTSGASQEHVVSSKSA